MNFLKLIQISIFLFISIFISLNFSYSATSQIFAGMNLTIVEDLSLTPSTVNDTFYDIVKSDTNKIFLKNSSLEEEYITYSHQSINLDKYSQNLMMKIIPPGDVNSQICSSNLMNFDCRYNYTSTDLSNRNLYSYVICNQDNLCLAKSDNSYKFLLNQLQTSKQILAGFVLTMTSDINITDLVISTPNYVYPTPTNNMKKTHITNLIINISDSNTQIESCRVVIDGDSYPMTYLNKHCSYTHTLPINNGSIQTYNFQVFYTESGIEHSLNQRKFHIYPNLDNQSKFPAFGFTSLIISLLILFVGFLFN